MNVCRGVAVVMLMLAAWAPGARAQGNGAFDLQAYKAFLSAHRDLTHEGLSALYPAGSFSRSVPGQSADPAYLDRIDSLYALTAHERQLLRQHDFVVTERLARASFGRAFMETYHADLPVFVSADAVLHAFHMSCDTLLQNYPNPFNGSTIISFLIPPGGVASNEEVTVFDLQGRQVRRLFAGSAPPGACSVRWDGLNDAGQAGASGVLFYRLRVNGFSTTRSMVLVR